MAMKSQHSRCGFKRSTTIIAQVLVYIILFPLQLLYILYCILRYPCDKSALKNKTLKKKHLLSEGINKITTESNNFANGDELLLLTEKQLDEVQKELSDGTISPLDVLHAYQLKNVKLYAQNKRGICEFIKESEELARNLGSKPYLPGYQQTLYGIPVSIKELCLVKGYDSTFGLAKRCLDPATEDSVVVQVLKDQGAIPFVTTATSQAAMSLSGINAIFGDMSNPCSDAHEPGGSSSGEGVIIKLNGSPVGIGTDLGGSIRIPSAFCGITGLKPTENRISSAGLSSLGYEPTIGFRVVVGPMARKVDDLAKAMRTLLVEKMFSLDSRVPPLPFNDHVYLNVAKQKLKIGFYDGFNNAQLMATVPSIKRAVHRCVTYLEEHGHEVIKFSPPNILLAYELAMKAFAIDTKYHISGALWGEELNEHTKLLTIAPNLSYFSTLIIDKLLTCFVGKQAGVLSFASDPREEIDSLKLLRDIEEYRKEFSKEWYHSGDFDVILCPVSAFPAISKTTDSLYCMASVINTLLYNLLDYPAGAVTVGSVSEEDIKNALAESNNADRYTKVVMRLQSESLGLPVAVQVVGKPWHEEVVLGVMKELESLANG